MLSYTLKKKKLMQCNVYKMLIFKKIGKMKKQSSLYLSRSNLCLSFSVSVSFFVSLHRSLKFHPIKPEGRGEPIGFVNYPSPKPFFFPNFCCLFKLHNLHSLMILEPSRVSLFFMGLRHPYDA